MTDDSKTFAPDHPWDRNFHLLFVLIGWSATFMGFGPTVIDRFHGKADYPAPLVLHAHAALFIGWLVLLTAQVLLIRVRKEPVHRVLGLTALALVPAMVVSSFLAERYSQHFYVPKDPSDLNFFAVPLGYLTMFAAFIAVALLNRRDPPAHKRWMLLANAVILGVPFARWWGEELYKLAGDGFWGMILHTYYGTDLLLLLLIAFDLITRRRLHPALLTGVPILLASQLLVSWAYHSTWWPPIARKIVGL